MKMRDTELATWQRQPAAVGGERETVQAFGGATVDRSHSLQAAIDQSPRVLAQRWGMQAAFGGAVQRQADGLEDDELLQARAVPALQRVAVDEDDEGVLQGRFEAGPVQRRSEGAGSDGSSGASADGGLAPVNETGMPNQLKAGIEALSGMDMSGVRVHRNSDKPAQLNALAYAQGSDIHLGPGQEQHLPHEAWHVVQQAQGRVRETVQMAGVGVNDEVGLEKEADLMGGRAVTGAVQLVAEGKRQDLTPRQTPRHAIVQTKAKVIIDSTGLNVDRDGDLKLAPDITVGDGKIYRHMSPKSTRLKVAEAFLRDLHGAYPSFVDAAQKLAMLQNQLTGFEHYTEHLNKQFLGSLDGNKKLNHHEYDSILLAAQKSRVPITKEFIERELEALAENYMYVSLSKRATSAQSFITAAQDKHQPTLDSMWMFSDIAAHIEETATKLGVSPIYVRDLLKKNFDYQKAHTAMGTIAGAAENAFIKNQWIGPNTQAGLPNRTYYKEATSSIGPSSSPPKANLPIDSTLDSFLVAAPINGLMVGDRTVTHGPGSSNMVTAPKLDGDGDDTMGGS